MLGVFEAVASKQPIGVSALARELDADKSAIQRDLMTLADANWIRPAPGLSGQWELSPHILTIARPPYSSDDLRLRARPLLERLRTETGETAYLAIQDEDHFVVLSAAESHHLLRMVPPVGIVIPMQGSATARAVLPHLSNEEQERLYGGPLPDDMRREFAQTLEHGFALNDEDIVPGAVAMASALTGPGGGPIGAIVLTGPADRLGPERRVEVGGLLRATALQLSRELA